MSEYIQQRYRYAAVYIIYANFHTSLQPDEFDLENPQNTKERAILEYLEEVKLVDRRRRNRPWPGIHRSCQTACRVVFPLPWWQCALHCYVTRAARKSA